MTNLKVIDEKDFYKLRALVDAARSLIHTPAPYPNLGSLLSDINDILDDFDEIRIKGI